jgi:hypothetical protein
MLAFDTDDDDDDDKGDNAPIQQPPNFWSLSSKKYTENQCEKGTELELLPPSWAPLPEAPLRNIYGLEGQSLRVIDLID